MWWHPARGLDLRAVRWEVNTRPPHVVVRLPDGSGVRVPISWTDAGVCERVPTRPLRFTSDSLLELTRLVESLCDRCTDDCVGASDGEDFDETSISMEDQGGARSE